MTERARFVLVLVGTLGSGIVLVLLGAIFGNQWLAIAGGVFLAPYVLVLLWLSPIILFGLILNLLYHGPWPLLRFWEWLPQKKEGVPKRERPSSAPVPLEGCYRLYVGRRAGVPAAADLVRHLRKILEEIQRLDWEQTALFAATPRGPVRVLGTWRDRVAATLDACAIPPGQRGPSDPTHRLDLSTTHDDEYTVRLSLQFVAGGAQAACPGIWVEASVAPLVFGPHLDGRCGTAAHYFSLLAETLGADFGYVDGPGEPVEASPWPTPRAGWLTYLPRPVDEVKAALPDRTIWPCGGGAVAVASKVPPAENLDPIRALL
jgi:hypothetical protein